MADRRMFSKTITSSAKFLKMPLETQALYFHLAQNADDDGVVEGFNVVRLVGSSEDSLKVLAAKQYIKVLNEDLVLFIVDWLEHNKIRKDRKKDSVYTNLLKMAIPEVDLLESRQRVDRPQLPLSNGTSHSQPKGCIGKVRLGEVNKDLLSSKPVSVTRETKEIVAYLNKVTGKSFKYQSKHTQDKVRARINEGFTVAEFKKVIDTKAGQWMSDDRMRPYLRPETLFSNKFEGYLNERPTNKPNIVETKYRIL